MSLQTRDGIDCAAQAQPTVLKFLLALRSNPLLDRPVLLFDLVVDH